jgi:succinate dehydrogenase (ubiquinone) flavoprotein subunit
MKHTITDLKNLSSETEIRYRAVITETLDKTEIDTLPPAKRVY